MLNTIPKTPLSSASVAFCCGQVAADGGAFAVGSNMRCDARRAWSTLQVYHTYYIPDCPGVYVVLNQVLTRPLQYIGSSTNLHNRVSSYRMKMRRDGVDTPWGFMMHPVFRVAECNTHEEALWLEARLIYRLQPPHNIAGRDRLLKPGRKSWREAVGA